MKGKLTINQVIKQSSFIKQLNPDPQIRSIYKLEQLNGDGANKTAKELLLYRPRMIAKGCHFSYNLPESRKEYRPLFYSKQLLESLNLIADSQLDDILSGKKVILEPSQGIAPFSIAYAGHQFGRFSGQLGDGRAINLFDIQGEGGNQQDAVTVQLKGSGRSIFSRGYDGKLTVDSSIREFICCEVLNALGIKTVRALNITLLPGTRATRGSTVEKCSVLSRYASNWVRLGNFELYRWQNDMDGMKKLLDWCLQRENLKDYQELYYYSVRENAKTMSRIQALGFLNGVLNTDNTSVVGFSMDYGPFTFLRNYDPEFDPTDSGRYSYKNQVDMVWWNLEVFGNVLGREFLGDRFEEILARSREIYYKVFEEEYLKCMSKRMGLGTQIDLQEFKTIILEPLLTILLKRKNIGYNNFFYMLNQKGKIQDIFFTTEEWAQLNAKDDGNNKYARHLKEQHDSASQWYKKYLDFKSKHSLDETTSINPIFIPTTEIIEDVCQILYRNDYSDITSLEKLYLMATNPFSNKHWSDQHCKTTTISNTNNEGFRLDLEEKWLSMYQECTPAKHLSCSS
ncbi:hypothetical protein TBLA_0A06040 [Henningerozyma blattae CBS 6284]|uniref:Selenoprotein O n=1 Tax=Henningerozyma blattae (strain ATCC 34711 / CBS 6284 / DSM 70876 / NBRC 10599 / NRRL Y-10934 / UCD 77-7) TaxID=1071380 RepID=I2GW95_HENB6|nr:hypothetical protein TBLA_0A06040 [Tetrapisispora blattae CBS 6284]CCH58397.1 hypothetical protein TBLA_0A06040 [Tetrapisispora blattae CBS 6284]